MLCGFMHISDFGTVTHEFKLFIVELHIVVICPLYNLMSDEVILHIYTIRFVAYLTQYVGIVCKRGSKCKIKAVIDIDNYN